MNDANHPAIGEQELAAINARAEAALALDADEWEDAVAAAAVDCALFCESLALFAGSDLE